jgi:hypothetical protein
MQGLSDSDDDEDMGGSDDEMDVAWGELKEAYHRQVRTAQNVRLGAEEVPWNTVVRLAMDFQNFKPQTGVLCPWHCDVVLGVFDFVFVLEEISVWSM